MKGLGMSKIWMSLWIILAATGCQEFLELKNLFGRGSQLPASALSPVVQKIEEAQLSLDASKNFKVNPEILSEIIQVIYDRQPKDSDQFENWVNALNQGASFEGVYNGLIHSSDYRQLEKVQGSASAEALRIFSEELARFEVELPRLTQFDLLTGAALPTSSEVPSEPSLEIDRVRESPAPSESLISELKGKQVQELSEQYSNQFVTISLFTLKRVLGDEALRVIDSKLSDRAQLSLWYSRWVVRLIQAKVEFGIPLRNNPDEDFHFKWAITSSGDSIKWEVLNRIHRLLNRVDRRK